VFYLVARFKGVDDVRTDASRREADRGIRALERQGLELEATDWHMAAKVKADGNILLADAYAVALAHERDATLVAGADNDLTSSLSKLTCTGSETTVCRNDLYPTILFVSTSPN